MGTYGAAGATGRSDLKRYVIVLQFVYFTELQVLTPALALCTAGPGGTGALLCIGQCVVVRVMMEDGLLCV